jgi:hypothetical protein
MIEGNGAAPPFLCRLVSLVEVSVVANQKVDLVGIKVAIVICLPQDFVPTVDAFQLRIIWQLYVMPAASFREGCVTQATYDVRCNVAASVNGLVVAQVCRGLPICFFAHDSYPATNASLRVTSMIDNPRHDFLVSADCFDAVQRLCHATFERELWTCALCSYARRIRLLGYTGFGSEPFLCFL